MTTTPRPKFALNRPQALALMALGYSLLAVFALYLSRQPGSLAVIWFANAWAVLLLLTRPRHDAPVLLAVQALSNLAVSIVWGDSLGLSLAFALANAAEVALSA